MPFTKGQSGNPGRRPKALADVQEAARARTTDAIGTLAAICMYPKVSKASRVIAANLLLDRGWGRPTQPVQASGNLTILDLVAGSMKQAG